jgi:hypothetical protein
MYHHTWLQIILQSHSNNSMELAQNKTHMEENRKFRIKPTYPETRKLILLYNKYMVMKNFKY